MATVSELITIADKVNALNNKLCAVPGHAKPCVDCARRSTTRVNGRHHYLCDVPGLIEDLENQDIISGLNTYANVIATVISNAPDGCPLK